MNEAQITLIKDAVRDVIKEERKSFWVEPEQHYLDHELLKSCRVSAEDRRNNHEFVARVRRNLEDTRGVVLKSIIGFIVLASLAWLGQAVIVGLAKAVAGVKG